VSKFYGRHPSLADAEEGDLWIGENNEMHIARQANPGPLVWVPVRATHGPTPLQAATDRMIENLAAVERGAWPMRIMLGVDAPVARVEWKDPAPLNQASLAAYQRHLDSWTRDLAACTKTPYDSTHHQEATMTIDKKDYVTTAVRTPAGSLAQRHIGSLVTITLPSGAEITDVLRAVSANNAEVKVDLANIGAGAHYDVTANRLSTETPHSLDPKSTILVRRPKPPVSTKKKGSTRR
jgi:hypothetical protein